VGKTIAILQSNYIPWKGYFDIINSVDEFVLFDEAQFTRRDWRNRNKIILNGVPTWLTIPVASKGQFHSAIRDMQVSDPDWSRKHWLTLQQAYRAAPHFRHYAPLLEEWYGTAADMVALSEINRHFLMLMAGLLDIPTPFASSDPVPRKAENPTGRLVEICLAHGATAYLSGPAARDYIETAQFEAAGITLLYADYAGYPVYPQQMSGFEHGVSMVDLLMICGPAARQHLKSVSLPGGLSGAT
jgi:hypothetical protein